VPSAPTPKRRASARAASADRGTARTAAASGQTASRRAASRRSAVPSLEDLAAPTGDAPTPGAGTAGSAAPPTGPPVLRVVPPTDSEPAADPDDATPTPATRPVRRAAGERGGGRDWADVLMGAAPAPPTAEPHQE
jgi:hypothetical protein